MFRQITRIAALMLLAGFSRAEAQHPSLDWIAGHWCVDLGEDTIEELWLPPHGGVVIGVGRTRTTERTTGFEYFRIVDRDGTQSYIAQPNGRSPTVFGRIAGGELWVRFENLEHDFPQRVEYRREGGVLRAQISGPGENGKDVVINFPYGRCDS